MVREVGPKPPPSGIPEKPARVESSIPGIAQEKVAAQGQPVGKSYKATSVLPKSLINVSQKAYYAVFAEKKIQSYVDKKDFSGLLEYVKGMQEYTTVSLNQMINNKSLLDHIVDHGELALINYLFQHPKTSDNDKRSILNKVLFLGNQPVAVLIKPLFEKLFSPANSADIAKIFNSEPKNEAMRNDILKHVFTSNDDAMIAKFLRNLKQPADLGFVIEKSNEQYSKGDKQHYQKFIKNIDFLDLIKPDKNQNFLYASIIGHALAYQDTHLLTSLIEKVPSDLHPYIKEQFIGQLSSHFQAANESSTALSATQKMILESVLKTKNNKLIQIFLSPLNDSAIQKILKHVQGDDIKLIGDNIDEAGLYKKWLDKQSGNP